MHRDVKDELVVLVRNKVEEECIPRRCMVQNTILEEGEIEEEFA